MSVEAFREALLGLAPDFGLELTQPTVERFVRHYGLLVAWNRKVNLTRITQPADAARRHFLESAYLTTVVERPARLVDVGSGAGFPGVPLACIWSDVDTVLVEPLLKRAVFLKEVVAALGLQCVRVRNAAYEAVETRPDDLLVARALDKFDALLPALVGSAAGTVALFSEPDLLSRAAKLAPERTTTTVVLPGAERRLIGVFRTGRATRPLPDLRQFS